MSHDVKHVQDEVIELLKKPLGDMISQDKVTKSKIIALRKSACKLVTVGDTTTAKVVSFNVAPDISVVDGLEKRSASTMSISKLKSVIASISGTEIVELYCTNQAGTISLEALAVLSHALTSHNPVMVTVIGEEDLMALPIIAYAPLDSTILYGQPSEGLVVVRVEKRVQKMAKHLMRRIGFKLDGV